MRGGAQAHLIEASDGHFYVVKFRNNPQHRRILVNEWVASTLLEYLQLSTAGTAIIDVPSAFLEANPDIRLQLGNRTIPAEPGWHFGSRYPGNPARLAVYDFLPDLLLTKVANLSEYAGMLAFDQWTSNADARQTVFYRAQVMAVNSPKPQAGFVASFVDHGYIFGGPEWAFHDSPLRGLYHRPVVYQSVKGWQQFEPWLERIRYFPEEIIDRALRSLPPGWVEDDTELLEKLLERLLRRGPRVASLLETIRDSDRSPFPNWK
jgi:hypothetical protein